MPTNNGPPKKGVPTLSCNAEADSFLADAASPGRPEGRWLEQSRLADPGQRL